MCSHLVLELVTAKTMRFFLPAWLTTYVLISHFCCAQSECPPITHYHGSKSEFTIGKHDETITFPILGQSTVHVMYSCTKVLNVPYYVPCQPDSYQ